MPGNRVRADRLRVVQVKQHGRMAFDGLQHVDKAPKDMRPDRLAFVAAGPHRGVGVDAEMVGPEPHQPLDETDLRTDCGIEPRLASSRNMAPRQRYLIGRLCGRGGAPAPRPRAMLRFRCRPFPPIFAQLRVAAGRACPLRFVRRCIRKRRGWRRRCSADRQQRPAPAPGRSSSATSAPRGSDAIASIVPARGPSPNRCSANAAALVSSVIGVVLL